MKKLTKKQRHEIYKECYKMAQLTGITVCFCCNSAKLLNDPEINLKDINSTIFPEYFLFEPEHHGSYWFGNDQYEGNEIRLMVLLLCIEMTA